jgi:hypothetical protein
MGLEEFDLLETPTLPPGIARFYQPLGWFAVGGLILTEYLRRQLPAPNLFTPEQTLYWFADHVLWNGKLLALAVMAFVPARPGLNLRFLLAGGGLLLMLGSVLKLGHPLYLAAVAVPFGAALKLAWPTEKIGILMVMAGLGLGVPLSGFTGLLAVKGKFHPQLMEQLLGSTAAIGALGLAAAYTGLYALLRLRFWPKH